jgi:hypothetical protein
MANHLVLALDRDTGHYFGFFIAVIFYGTYFLFQSVLRN